MAKVNYSEYILNVPEKWRLAFRQLGKVTDPNEEREQAEWDKIKETLLSGHTK